MWVRKRGNFREGAAGVFLDAPICLSPDPLLAAPPAMTLTQIKTGRSWESALARNGRIGSAPGVLIVVIEQDSLGGAVQALVLPGPRAQRNAAGPSARHRWSHGK